MELIDKGILKMTKIQENLRNRDFMANKNNKE